MAVRFTDDYRGKLTAEVYFLAGTEESFSPETEKALIAAGRAEAVVKKGAGSKDKAKSKAKTK